MLKTIAIDLETSGLYPTPGVSKIFCCAVNDGKSIKVHTNIESLRTILEDKNVLKIIHSASFDCFWLKRMSNITVRNVWCTRLMEQIILGENVPRTSNDENLKKELSSSLLYTLSRYGLAERKDKHMQLTFATRAIDKPLTPEEIKYAMEDVRYLPALQVLQERRLIKLKLTRVANLENNLAEVLVDMRARGIGFDLMAWMNIAAQNETEYNSLLKRLPPSVENWSSPLQIKKYFQSMGIPMESITDAEELQKTYNNPTLGKFIQMRSLYKNVTTYGKSWLLDDPKYKKYTVDSDGRIRADFEQILNSGRLSCSHPNLQQIPRIGNFRAAFVPAKGNVLVVADYPSQEIAIAAAASNEERWIKAILRGDDIHAMTASIVFANEWQNGYEKGCTFPKRCKCKVHEDKRQIAKVTNFTILYGGGAFNIASKTNMLKKDAERVVYKFKKSAPKLTRWLNTNAKNAIQTRISFSASPFKRRRTLRDPEDWMLSNIGKNNPIQGCGADMIKLAMISLNQEICPLVLTEHDMLAVEVKKSKAKAAIKELKGVMEKAADYCTGVPGLIKVTPYIAMNLNK